MKIPLAGTTWYNNFNNAKQAPPTTSLEFTWKKLKLAISCYIIKRIVYQPNRQSRISTIFFQTGDLTGDYIKSPLERREKKLQTRI